MKSLFLKMANAIRILSIDAIYKAKSGHTGMPLGMAEIAVALWFNHFKHNPLNPKWINRDRFILSNGHGSMLLYSLLHLTGYNISIQDIKNFRQLLSNTPGHPENKCTIGVETTTGPLGQGLANAIGIALAEKLLSIEFNKPNLKIIDHYTYVFVGDGCLMEGISHEVCSLAGTLKLSKLIVLYDKNNISIDGNTDLWFNENTEKRFKAYNWNVITNINGHNIEEINFAIYNAKKSDKPTIIFCKTIIGKGSPNFSGTSKIHGPILNKKEILLIRKKLNWNFLKPFFIPKEIYSLWDTKKKGKYYEDKWNLKFNIYKNKYKKKSDELIRRINNILPINFTKIINNYINNIKNKNNYLSTRKASQMVIQELSKILPEFLGGSSDLTESTCTFWDKSKSININFPKGGNYINYGVREFGMSAIINGISLYGGYIVFGSTFLAFSDYSRNAIRMAALMKIRSIFIFTHDSIAIGEDGPTHQPIEHISSLRLIPNLDNWRPCDLIETIIAWKEIILKKTGPSTLILCKQNLLQLKRTNLQIKNIKFGGYILKNPLNPNAILIATGSEVQLAIKIFKKLKKEKIFLRIISMPNLDIFNRQNISYKKNIINNKLPCFSIEAGVTNIWKSINKNIYSIGINTFGKSGKIKDLFNYFKLNTKEIIKKIKKKINIK